jgi:deoxyribonucleoside regulator
MDGSRVTHHEEYATRRTVETVKVAHYYYNCGLNQQEIADKLNTSRQRVNRLLQKALSEGIVEIRVHGYKDSNAELEIDLENRFQLHEARVVEDGAGEMLGSSVIEYLENTLEDNTNIGVTYGSTLAQICRSGSVRLQGNVNVIQLAGGANIHNVAFKPDEIANRFATFFGGKAYSLYVPAIVDNPQLKELMSHERQFQKIFCMYKEIDIAVMAVGALKKDTILVRDGYLEKDDFNRLVNKDAVGDVCFRFFDIHGRIVDPDLNNRVTGISMEDLKRIPLRMGVAYGQDKVMPLIAAVRGGYINIIVTDTRTARLLLEYQE